MSEYKKIESGKSELICTIDGEKWKDAQKHSFDKLAKSVEVKGFRKGQVPEKLVKKVVSDQQVMLDAAESLAQDALLAGIEEHDIDLIDRPNLDIETIDADKLVLKFICAIEPDFELGDYKSIKYELEPTNINDFDIDREIDTLREKKAEIEIKEEGTVDNHDIAVIDFEGFVDGVAFEGGKGENYELEIGSNTFIPGFEGQLIGMATEEEKDINVTFPEDYHAEDLKGKPAVFKVKVHEIKKKVLPELTDDFVKEVKLEGVETVEELKKFVADKLKTQKETENENKATDKLLSDLCDSTEIDVPEVMIENETDELMRVTEERLRRTGFSIDQYLNIVGQTKEQMREATREDAKKKVKINMILEKIFKTENMEVSAEDIAKDYEEMAKYYGLKLEDMKNYVTERQVKYDLSLRKALDFLKTENK